MEKRPSRKQASLSERRQPSGRGISSLRSGIVAGTVSALVLTLVLEHLHVSIFVAASPNERGS